MTISSSGSSTTINIVDGAGNNRLVIMMASQFRTPTNIPTAEASYLLNGVTPSGTISIFSGSASLRTVGLYWLDSKLPSAPGSYSFSFTGSSEADTFWIQAKDIDQIAPEQVLTPAFYSVASSSDTLNYSNSAGALIVGCIGSNANPFNLVATQGVGIAVVRSGILYNETGSVLSGTHALATNRNIIGASFKASSSLVVISGVDGVNSLYPGKSSTITLQAGGATQGTGFVKLSPTDNINDINAVIQTVTSWGDTSISFTVNQGNLPFGTVYVFVQNDSGTSNATGFAKVFTSESGKSNVTISGFVDPSGLVGNFPNLAIGDQIEGDTTSLEDGSIIYDASGNFSIDYGVNPTPQSDSFQVRYWDNDLYAWSSFVTVSIGLTNTNIGICDKIVSNITSSIVSNIA